MIKPEKAKREKAKAKKMNLIVIPVTILSIVLIVLAFESPAIQHALFPGQTASLPEIDVCMHLSGFNGNTVADLQSLRVRWVRVDWLPGQMDSFVQAMHDNNINVLATIDSNTFNNQNITLSEWNSTLNSIMQSSAAAYVGAWEIWNEPNNPTWPEAYFTPDVYHEMLLSAFTIIRGYSNAWVVTAGLAPINGWTDYLTALYSFNNTRSYVDFQGVHVYDNVSANLALLNTVEQITSNRPIWITEYGAPSAPSDEGYSLQSQASWLQSNFVSLQAHAVKTFWYEFYDESTQPSMKENSFGLIMLNETRKPSFDTLTNIAYGR